MSFTVSGASGARSRAVHVVQVENLDDVPRVGSPIRWTADNIARAACGALVHPARTEVKESNEVCRKCRKALGWAWIVEWTSHGHTFVTDFRQ